ncbi:aminotransferase class IV [Thermaurantiacus sp.]
MPAFAYVNGRYLPLAHASLPVEDRGTQFADAVYEVIAMFGSQPLDWRAHCWRLRRGLAALFIAGAPEEPALAHIAKTLWRRARLEDGLLYIQVSRGTARRDHGFPANTAPNLVMTARAFDFRQRLRQQQTGVAVVSLPDQRWQRCDLKTTGLLGAVLGKAEARRLGAFEAMFYREDGTVTEGASTNMWLVEPSGTLVTHPLSAHILPGVMRETVLRLARDAQFTVAERPFTLAQARTAPELFLTSTTGPLLPITRLDGRPVGTGTAHAGIPGPTATRLATLLWNEITRQTGWHP